MSIKEKMREKRKLQVCKGKTLNGEERASTPSTSGSIRTGMCKPQTRAGAQGALWQLGLHPMLMAASVSTTQAGLGPKYLFMVVVPACVVWGFLLVSKTQSWSQNHHWIHRSES